jgi:ferrochelatase
MELDASSRVATFAAMNATTLSLGRKPRVAIVLLNLGGPDKMESVYPFLLNLFLDPAILRVPVFIRPLLARIIAFARKKPASANYALLGGKSPLLDLTIDQAAALERSLPELDARCFIAMRYWHPFSDETARDVKAFDPDEVVLLPLYPQHSTTTTGSSFTAWREAASAVGLVKPTTSICCYHSDPAFVAATAAIVRKSYLESRAELDPAVKLRVLFSAHGLPESIIASGDPYQHQVERTVAAVVRQMAVTGMDHLVCYQSRATPQKWIGPSTEDEIARAGREKVALLVVPIAFVSDHSETLVELDIEYRELAEEDGVPAYFRAPVQNADPAFIQSLADLVRRSRNRGVGLCSFAGSRTCYKPHTDCPHARAGAVAPAGPEPVPSTTGLVETV